MGGPEYGVNSGICHVFGLDNSSALHITVLLSTQLLYILILLPADHYVVLFSHNLRCLSLAQLSPYQPRAYPINHFTGPASGTLQDVVDLSFPLLLASPGTLYIGQTGP
jgi:hypothetical protein